PSTLGNPVHGSRTNSKDDGFHSPQPGRLCHPDGPHGGEWQELAGTLDLLAAAARDLVKAGRRHDESIRELKKANLTLTRLANGHSKLKRIAHLEGRGT